MAAASALAIAQSASASTLLFADNFDEVNGNNAVSTFNNNLAESQSGSLVSGGPIDYTVTNGSGYVAQHSNGNRLLIAASGPDNIGYGNVSLNYDFAAAANSLDQALVFSFNIMDVFGFNNEPSNWIAFSINDGQNEFVSNGYAGLIFRKSGGTQLFGDGSNGPNWTAGDNVTITLSNTAGNGSAFNGNGSVAKIKIGSNTESVFTLAQQSSAFITVNAIPAGEFGGGTIDNLSVTAVPEPSAALLGGLGILGLLRRRRN